jgi:hypothetical protein
MISAIRNAIAKTNILTEGTLPSRSNERSGAAFMHTINASIQGVNAFVAGTPISYVTAPIAMAVGGVEWCVGGLLTFFSSGTSPGQRDAGKGLRRDGAIAFLAGASAAVPVYGNYVNGVTAGYNAAHAVNNGIPG